MKSEEKIENSLISPPLQLERGEKYPIIVINALCEVIVGLGKDKQ